MNDYIINNEPFLKRARHIRNELLNKTDKYLLSDYPFTLDEQMKIKLYREELRNYINYNEIKILAGQKVDFPPLLDFINLNIV